MNKQINMFHTRCYF